MLHPLTTPSAPPKVLCVSPSSVRESCSPLPPPPSFTSPRSFNTIAVHGDVVVKTSSAPSIHGELYFYRHMPADVSHLFPRLLWYSTTPTNPASVSFAIDRIPGRTMSDMLLDGKLTIKHLHDLLARLAEVHSSMGEGMVPDEKLAYANHSRKVAARAAKYKSLYEEVGLRAGHFRRLLALQQDYEDGRRGRVVRVVHGDPVLTNVILGEDGVRFVDMRGAQGTVETLSGDAIYDMAKVAQSLLGYDYVLAGREVDKTEVGRLRGLVDVLRGWVEGSGGRWEDVLLVVCGLLTSLIPLHDGVGRRRRFAAVARALLRFLEVGGTTCVVKVVAVALRGKSTVGGAE